MLDRSLMQCVQARPQPREERLACRLLLRALRERLPLTGLLRVVPGPACTEDGFATGVWPATLVPPCGRNSVLWLNGSIGDAKQDDVQSVDVEDDATHMSGGQTATTKIEVPEWVKIKCSSKTFSINELLVRDPSFLSASVIEPICSRKSNWRDKLFAIIWALIVIVSVFSIPFFREMTGWSFIWRHWNYENYYNHTDTGMVNGRNYTYYVMGEEYNHFLVAQKIGDIIGRSDNWYEEFCEAHPTGTSFTVYYDREDPSDATIFNPKLEAGHFVVPWICMPWIIFLLLLCLQPLFTAFCQDGRQIPIFLEHVIKIRSVREKGNDSSVYGPVTFGLDDDDNDDVLSSRSTNDTYEYRIWLRKEKLSSSFPYFLGSVVGFTYWCSMMTFTFFGTKAALIITPLAASIMLFMYVKWIKGEYIEIDPTNQVLRHEGDVFCMNDIHMDLRVTRSKETRIYDIMLTPPPNLECKPSSSSSPSSNPHVLFQTESWREVVKLLTLLLRSDPPFVTLDSDREAINERSVPKK